MEGLGVIDPGIRVRRLEVGFLELVGLSLPVKGRTARMAPRGGGIGGDGDCRVCVSGGDLWVRVAGGDGGGELVGQVGGFSHESEHDLAVMVSDFLENGSGGVESRYSSDSDSGFSDLGHLAERVLLYKHAVDQYQMDLLSTVHSLLLSMDETDLHYVNDAPCNGSCIRQSIVKSLGLSGYDAAVCSSKWQGFGRVPGGDHEYIDVSIDGTSEDSDRLIVDIDFRSHFEIARAVESYGTVLTSLPVVYVGSLCRLEEFLQVMVEASKCSLKQNSMPLPPWRSLAYLRAKWHSKFERMHYKEDEEESLIGGGINPCDHRQCRGHLRRLKASLQGEMEMDRLLKPTNKEKKRRVKFDRQRQSLLSG